MSVVMKAVNMAKGHDSGVDGQYLKSMDWEVEPAGDARFTPHIEQAMRFRDAGEAMRFYRRVHPTVPIRPDGKKNRPLTALTISLENVEPNEPRVVEGQHRRIM